MEVTPFHILVFSCVLISLGFPRQSGIRFIRNSYNVTVPESSVGRTLVTCKERMGVIREGTKEEITFRIMSGDPDRIFRVEEKPMGDFIFLVLRTRGGNPVVLNRERKDKFALIVKAYSSVSTAEATTTIYVQVLDQNDLSPIFFSPSYNTTVSEDFGLNGEIIQVTAEDADLGVNGEVMYWFKELTEYFAIHPTLGVVTLTKPLKYSDRSVHDLTIIAQDRATIFRGGGQYSSTKLSVRVKQVNFFGPEIYAYVLPEPSVHRNGFVYAAVRVVDRDDGIHGEIDGVHIVQGNTARTFFVDTVHTRANKTEYNIVLSNEAHIFENTSFNLSLQVTDRGFPQKSSYKAVSITVSACTQIEPQFERDLYTISVPEYISEGSIIIKLRLKNTDWPLKSDVGGRIVEGNVDKKFGIHDKTLVLYSIAPFDAEQQLVYTLVIQLYLFSQNPLKKVITTKVKVNVIDCNDNYPVFSETPEHLWVNENWPVGTPIQVVPNIASDLDSGDNGFVTYSITNGRTLPFEIDPLSGVLRTIQHLDYETMRRRYTIKIRASDSGRPYRRESERVIKVDIKNQNDNSPEFLKGECSLSIPRNLKIGTDLFLLTATDLDEIDTIKYTSSASIYEGCIEIDTSRGMLSLQCNLSEVTESEWALNVSATDGLYWANTTVRVFVSSTDKISTDSGLVQYSCKDFAKSNEDLSSKLAFGVSRSTRDNILLEHMVTVESDNLYAPKIVNVPETIYLDDTTTPKSNIISIHTIDEDGGYNGKVFYGMTRTPEEFNFQIDTDSGCISLISDLNFWRQNEYALNISACDLGTPQRCTYEILLVKIKDVLSKRPHFKENIYKISVSEGTKVGTELLKVNGFIKNNIQDGSLIYKLITELSSFSVNNLTGSIVLMKPLDRELQEEHRINVRSINTYYPNDNFDDVLIVIYVTDINDQPPLFINTKYEVSVREDLPEGCVVYIVESLDQDTGLGGVVHYSLPSSEMFTIDSTTGTVRLKARLDYETASEHKVLIRANDEGIPSLTSEVTLVIHVQDVNENLYPPTFDEVVFASSVSENRPTGVAVCGVTAVDMDHYRRDSKITYSIIGGTGYEYFTIDEQGKLST